MTAKAEIAKFIAQVEDCITNGQYKAIETDKVELKDLSGGDDWKELYKTTCAFLNSKGGIIIIGINENRLERKYTLTGYSDGNEDKLKSLPKQFTDDSGKACDLSEYIRPDSFEIIEVMGKRLCAVFVEKLPEDQKFVLFKGIAYERNLTGDHKISPENIIRQKELRKELELSRELTPVPDATIENIDIDKINDYIQRLNQDIKVETYKSDVISSVSFLERKKFIVKEKPTLLGMLVCGNHIHDFIGARCQVDCFVESPEKIAENKKSYRDNIIQLLERSYSFIISSISTGISVERGGTRILEYPERLIRETINNALAHRDYSVNRFVNVTVNPGKTIEIRNPGKFREEQIIRVEGEFPLRRIIPVPKATNPRLADILKYFDRWEGKGWGMSSLTNAALNNDIDLPWYFLYSDNDIGLFIPKGRVLDDEIKGWLKIFSKYILSKTNGYSLNAEQETALAYFLKSERFNKQEKYTIALTPDNNHFSVIKELEGWGLIYKHPKSPQLHPIYLVDRQLIQSDFTKELRDIFGGDYDELGKLYKEVLNVVYHFNEFSLAINDINAAQVGDFLYYKQNPRILDVKHYNDYKRRIRTIIKNLTNKKFLLQEKEKGRKYYMINRAYQRTQSLFDKT
jgi:ATP-dependent DNA helicase RecG